MPMYNFENSQRLNYSSQHRLEKAYINKINPSTSVCLRVLHEEKYYSTFKEKNMQTESFLFLFAL